MFYKIIEEWREPDWIQWRSEFSEGGGIQFSEEKNRLLSVLTFNIPIHCQESHLQRTCLPERNLIFTVCRGQQQYFGVLPYPAFSLQHATDTEVLIPIVSFAICTDKLNSYILYTLSRLRKDTEYAMTLIMHRNASCVHFTSSVLYETLLVSVLQSSWLCIGKFQIIISVICSSPLSVLHKRIHLSQHCFLRIHISWKCYIQTVVIRIRSNLFFVTHCATRF